MELPPLLSIEQLQEQVAELVRAVHSNRVIGAAIGIVMERHGLDYAGAHAYLIRLSQNSNVKLASIAANMVTAAGSHGGPVDAEFRGVGEALSAGS